MDNVIGRVNLELNTVDSGDGLVAQGQVARWAQEELVPTLEQILDEWPASADVVWVERLDIELKPLAAKHWQAATLDELKRELAVSLLWHLEEAPSESFAPEEQETNDASVASGIRTAPTSEDGVLSALLHYLRHGHLPWYWSADEPFEVVVQRWLRTASTAELAGELLPELRGQNAARRFVRGLSNHSLRDFVAHWVSIPPQRWRQWQRDVHSVRELMSHASVTAGALPPTMAVVDRRTPGHDLPERFWVQLLAAIAGAQSIGDSDSQPFALDPVSRAIAGLTQDFIDASAHPQALLDEIQRLPALQQRFVSAEFGGAIVHLLATRPPSGVPDIPTAATSSSHAAQRALSPSSARGATPETSSFAPQGQFVSNAGLVLLAPYVRMFLERIGLVDDVRLSDSAAALTAVQFLATGPAGTAQEHELTLPKILCGIDLEEVPSSLSQVDSEVAREADELLMSIIEHWAALKNTTVDSFRETFLRRDGKLALNDDGNWLLHVEQMPYDMLLSRLPWSYRMIRLPWMDRMLITQWVD